MLETTNRPRTSTSAVTGPSCSVIRRWTGWRETPPRRRWSRSTHRAGTPAPGLSLLWMDPPRAMRTCAFDSWAYRMRPEASHDPRMAEKLRPPSPFGRRDERPRLPRIKWVEPYPSARIVSARGRSGAKPGARPRSAARRDQRPPACPARRTATRRGQAPDPTNRPARARAAASAPGEPGVIMPLPFGTADPVVARAACRRPPSVGPRICLGRATTTPAKPATRLRPAIVPSPEREPAPGSPLVVSRVLRMQSLVGAP